jgi:hypothetical protein
LVWEKGEDRGYESWDKGGEGYELMGIDREVWERVRISIG